MGFMSSYGRIRDVCGNPIPYGNPYATVIMTTVAYYVAYYVAYFGGTVEVIPGGGVVVFSVCRSCLNVHI